MLQSYVTTFANANWLQLNRRRPKENMATEAKEMNKVRSRTYFGAAACRYISEKLSDAQDHRKSSPVECDQAETMVSRTESS